MGLCIPSGCGGGAGGGCKGAIVGRRALGVVEVIGGPEEVARQERLTEGQLV